MAVFKNAIAAMRERRSLGPTLALTSLEAAGKLDYIVDEIRRVREEQASKCAFDVKAILAAARKRQRRSARKVVSLVQKKKLSA